jgi:hypothetical protein
LVIESRRATGYSAGWDLEDNGSFVYLVDVTKDNDRSGEGAGDWGNEEAWDKWAYLLLPEGQQPFRTDRDSPDPQKNPYKRYLLKPGSKVVFDGIEITLLESGVVDAVRIRRTAESKDISVGAATGVIRPYQPKKIPSLNKLEGNLEGIAYWPWKLGADKITFGNPNRNSMVTSKSGPNTKVIPGNSRIGFDLASSLFDRFKQPSDLFPIYFSFEDARWAQEQFNALTSNSKGNEVQSICPSKDVCAGSHVEIGSSGRAFVLIALTNKDNQSLVEELTLAQARAFAIAVQQSTFKDTLHESKAFCCIADFVPTWFTQGLAELTSAIAVSLQSHEKYLSFRKQFITELKSQKLSLKDIQNFLSTQEPNVWKNRNSQLNSQIGFLTIEALISAKGINAPMQVLAYQAQDPQATTPGRFSFKDALERRERSSEEDLSGTPYFGVEWEQAILLVSKHVFDAINS